MSDDEKQLVVGMMQEVMARTNKKKAGWSSFRDNVNFVVTVLGIPLVGLLWFILTQQLKITTQDLTMETQKTFVAKDDFNSVVTEIHSTDDRQWQAIKSNADKENSDKSVTDLKIQTLQDSVSKPYTKQLDELWSNSLPHLAMFPAGDTNSFVP